MRSLRHWLVLSSVVTVVGAASLGACGSDTVVPYECNATDSSTDAPEVKDTGLDAKDSQVVDASDAADTADVPVIPDAETVDGFFPDVGPVPDVGPTLLQSAYPDQMAKLYCARLSACCLTTSDAGSFNMQQCVSHLESYNLVWTDTLALVPGLLLSTANSPNINFDAAAAQQCFDALNNLSCGLLGEFTWKNVEAVCRSAYKGKIAIGGVCSATAECTQPAFCKIGDAGTGVCTALVGKGGACGFGSVNANKVDEQCGSQVSGVPRICDGKTKTCIDQLPFGGDCSLNGNVACQSNICIPNAQFTAAACNNQFTLANGALCKFYK